MLLVSLTSAAIWDNWFSRQGEEVKTINQVQADRININTIPIIPIN
jgi:hypothetical protein